MVCLSLQAIGVILTALSIVIISLTLYFSYKSYIDGIRTELREAIRDVGERGLESKLKVESHFDGCFGRWLFPKKTSIVFQFLGRSSVAGGGTVEYDETRADNSPWTTTVLPEFEDEETLYRKIREVDGVERVEPMTRYGWSSKQVIYVECSTIESDKCKKIVDRILTIISDEHARDPEKT